MPRQTQRELNQKMRDAGRLRAQTSIEKSLRLGAAHLTPAGAAIVRRTVGPLADTITAFIAEAQAGKAGRRNAAMLPLASVDPHLAAFLAVQYALDGAEKRAYVQTVARAIGRALDGELTAVRFQASHPALYNYIVKNERERGRPDRQIMTAILTAEKTCAEDPARWSKDICLHVGLKLVELAETSLGVFKSTHVRSKRTAQSYVLELTDGATEWFTKLNAVAVANSPLYMPTVEPPIDWIAPVGGGLSSDFIRPVKLVKTRTPLHRAALDTADLSQVYEAVNHIQHTPWQVNAAVLDVMQRMWDAPAAYPAMPPKADSALPDMPDHIRELEPQDPVRLAFRRERRAIHQANTIGRSARLNHTRLLAFAHSFAGGPLYFPHNLDFRGRVYPLSSVLTPQGDDAQKALLHFHEGKPLGMDGLYWLGIHGANVYGYDKVPLDDRYAWAVQHMSEAMSVAYDPMTDLSWTEADSPWQYLAWCLEWANVGVAQSTGHTGYEVVSRLPIALDGSCNGLQHFAAMLRDPVAGEAVNLLPSPTPQDIYQRVADVVSYNLTSGNHSGEHELWAANWLAFGIDRNITKRAVMVLPYGGTFSSCREYVSTSVKDRGGADTAFGADLRPAVTFLAQHVWAAMAEVIVSGRQVMGWIQQMARACAAEGKTLSWTTPTGFPVVQHYPRTQQRNIQTRFHGNTTQWKDHTDTDQINAGRLALASSPNFVHSLDAAALMLTVNEAAQRGITAFAMIHDSYGTHAADTQALNEALRDTFVSMYQTHDPLKELWHTTQEVLGKFDLDPPPSRGTLDLEDVKKSQYFFA